MSKAIHHAGAASTTPAGKSKTKKRLLTGFIFGVIVATSASYYLNMSNSSTVVADASNSQLDATSASIQVDLSALFTNHR